MGNLFACGYHANFMTGLKSQADGQSRVESVVGNFGETTPAQL